MGRATSASPRALCSAWLHSCVSFFAGVARPTPGCCHSRQKPLNRILALRSTKRNPDVVNNRRPRRTIHHQLRHRPSRREYRWLHPALHALTVAAQSGKSSNDWKTSPTKLPIIGKSRRREQTPRPENETPAIPVRAAPPQRPLLAERQPSGARRCAASLWRDMLAILYSLTSCICNIV